MTAYTLISGQRVASNAPGAPAPTPVVVSGRPTRGRVTLSVVGSARPFVRASVWAQTALTPYNYAETIPLLVMSVGPGVPQSVSDDLPFDMAYYNYLFGQVDEISIDGGAAATLTLVV